MAYENYSTLKRMVANRLGKVNQGTSIPIRDYAIVDACKQIYQDAKFDFLLKYTTISLTSGAANLPSDFVVTYGIEQAYITSTEIDGYTPISVKDKDLYTTSDHVYWITFDASNKVFVFNTLQQTGTIKLYYFMQPSDLSDGADITPIPDPMCIVYLAVAMYWLASERDEDEFNRFNGLYKERLAKMLSQIRTYNPKRREMGSILDREMNTLPTSSITE